MAQLVERRLQDPVDSMTRGSNRVRGTRKSELLLSVRGRGFESVRQWVFPCNNYVIPIFGLVVGEFLGVLQCAF